MKVGIKSATDKSTVGEMHGGSGEVGYIAEMLTDSSKLETLVPVAGIGTKAAALATAMNDDNPEFPVVRVEEGWSNSKRLWTGEMLRRIAEQVNALEPVGHLGHIPDDQAPFAFPEPQTTWLGAVTKQEPSKQKSRLGEMVTTFYVGGYNHPGAKVRSYIKTRSVRGISWWGNGTMSPVPGQGVEVKTFDLKALDWARKLAEGMPTSSVVAVTGEMEGNMDKDLSQVTPEEFKKENPNGYALLVRDAQAEQATRISEMEGQVEEAKKSKTLLDQVMALLGIEDANGLVDEVTKLKNKVGEKASMMVKEALGKLMEEKIPNEEKRQLVLRLLPVGEMETKATDCQSLEDVQKLVGEMVDASFNKDEVIQGIVGEMAPPVVRRREELRSGAGIDNNPYVTRERVTI